MCNCNKIGSNNCNTWYVNVKQLLCDLGFQFLWNNITVNNGHIAAITQRIYDPYLQHYYNDIKTSSKLETFSLIKNNHI